MRDINSVFGMIIKYSGKWTIPIMFVVCVIWLFWWKRKEKKELLYMTLLISFSILLLFNDLSYNLLGKFTDRATFYRFCWAIPMLAVISYVLVTLLQKVKKMWQKVLAVLVVGLVLWQGCDTYLTTAALTPSKELEKVSSEVEEVAEIIQKNKISQHPNCVFDIDMQIRIRVKEPDIILCVPRKQYMYFINNGYDTGKYRYYARLVQAVNNGEKVSSPKLRRALKKKKVDFVVLKREYQRKRYWKRVGGTLVGTTEHYLIYQFAPQEEAEGKQ